MSKQQSENKGWRWKRILLITLLVIFSICLIGATVLGIMFKSILSDIKRVQDDGVKETYSKEQLQQIGVDVTDTVPVVDPATTIVSGENVINILLVGQDRREGQGRQRSDAMILCTINKEKKTMTMTSFMRDLWVYIPDYFNERLNVAYMLDGFSALNKTLDYNFGVSADKYFEIDFSGFMSAIDIVGGVEIELTGAEARYLNRWGNWDVEPNKGWQLKEGVNLLNGSQALAYSRIREIGDDFERTERQRNVLMALFDKAKTLGPLDTYDLIAEIAPLLTTNLSDGEIMKLAMEIVPLISELEIVSQRVPMDGQFYYHTTSGGASVIALTESQLEENKKLLVDTIQTEETE